MSTRVTEDLLAHEQTESDPERAELLRRARIFKTSWLELAQALSEVRRSGRYQSWGFEDFYAYARSELHLRNETIDKLTASYAFLRRKAPDILARDPLREKVPSYQAVDFLRRAEEASPPRDGFDELADKVLHQTEPLSRVSKEYKTQIFGETPPTPEGAARAVRTAALRLKEVLGTGVLSPKVDRELRVCLDAALAELAPAGVVVRFPKKNEKSG